jgi:asparagine synthase (glutamine-hydrolysing)
MLTRLVKQQGITVALSGDGSDEIFAGYYRYFADRYVTWMRLVPSVLRRTMTAMTNVTGSCQKLVSALGKADLTPLSPERYMTWYHILGPKERATILAPEISESTDAPYRSIASLLKDISISNDQEFLCYLDLTMWIAEESNMRVDKMSMAHALEIRAPFQDYTLADQAMSIPFDEKASWRESKMLLKASFADLLPEVVLKRPKLGWLCPSYLWLKDSLWEDAKRLISWLPETRIFSPHVARLVETPLTPSTYYKIWNLMVFALWYQEFIGLEKRQF